MQTLQEVGGPAAWLGSEMQQRADWVVELGTAHATEIREALANAKRTRRSLLELGRDDFPVPGLDPVLTDLVRELLTGRGFVVLRGVPLDGLSETEIELLFWGLGLHIGIALPQGADGTQPLAHVRDEGVDRNLTRGGGLLNRHSGALPFHTDSSDIVGLLCINPAMRGGASTIVSTAMIHDEICRSRPDLLSVMYEPWWFDRRKGDGPESFVQCPIFAVNDSGRLFAFYGPDYYKSAPRGAGIPQLSEEQVEAMLLIDSMNARPEMQLHMELRRGDVQLINNYSVMHSRTAYEDWPEPSLRRDLIRLWLTLDQDLDVPGSFAERGFVPRATAFKR